MIKISIWFTGGELNGASVWSISDGTWHTVSTACLFAGKTPGHAGPRGKLAGQFAAGQPSVPSDKIQREFCWWNSARDNGHWSLGAYTFYPKPHISDSKNDSKTVHRLYAY